MTLDVLRAEAIALPDDASRLVVPEHAVKRALAELGVPVPRGVVAPDATNLTAAAEAEALRPPLVLKAWGPGIVHKTDLGAVCLDLAPEQLEDAAATVHARLHERGVHPAGFLVEEQHGGGVELLVGVARRPPFGPIAMLGAGGVLTEVLDRTVARLCPLTRADAIEMVDAFPAPALLDGARGRPAVNHDALGDVLLVLAGEDGLVARLGGLLAELECNPLLVDGQGAVALDARLVLLRDKASSEAPPPTDFTPLFRPRSIAVAGASTTKVTFGNRFLAAYRDAGWTDGLYAVHPGAGEIDGVPAVASVADVPGGVDYLLVAVPAERCPELVRSARSHARFAHVISGGFAEAGREGAELEHELGRAAREARVRVLGPNCLGLFSPAGRQTFQLGAPRGVGRVAVISQSGGLAGDIVKAGDHRGIGFAAVVTVGNAVDVTASELLDHFVDDDAVSVVGTYLEGARDSEQLVAALRRARGHKPVVILAAGASVQGAEAVVSHTGAMAGDIRMWDAVAASTGATIVGTVEDLLAVLAFVQRYPTATGGADDAVLVVGPGGGASVLATDACDRHGLVLTPVRADVRQRLRDLGYGAGTSVANPLEIPLGPSTGPDAFDRVLDPLLDAQPYPDVLLHVNVQSYLSYGDGAATDVVPVLERLAARDAGATRLVVVLRNVECAPPEDERTLLAAAATSGLPLLRTFDEAALAIAAAKRFARGAATTRA